MREQVHVSEVFRSKNYEGCRRELALCYQSTRAQAGAQALGLEQGGSSWALLTVKAK